MRIPVISGLLEWRRSSATHADIDRLRHEAALDRRKRTATLARLGRMEAEVAESMTRRLVESLEFDDENDWGYQGGAAAGGAFSGQFRSLDQARNASRELSGTSPTAVGLIERAADFTLGRNGLTLTLNFEDSDPDVEGEPFSTWLVKQWRRWKRSCKWHLSSREAFTRLLRDGEKFRRWFDLGPERLVSRFVDPEQVPPGGVVTAAGDAETVEGFRIRHGGAEEYVPGDEIDFGKIGTDANEARGLPWLHQSVADIRCFDQFMKDLALLVHIRTAIALVRKHKGTPAAVRSFAAARKTGTTDVTDSGVSRTLKREKIRAGTILDTTAGTEYSYLEPNIDVGRLDGYPKLIALRIAQRTGLPLHLSWMEAHSATLAGILVAETPGVKTLERLQGLAEDADERPAFRQWLRWLCRWNRLPKTAEDILEGATFQGPRYPRRERLDEVNADSRLYRDGAISLRTYRIRDNLDPDEEERLCAEEETKSDPYGASGDAEDAEDADREARRARLDAGANKEKGKDS